jgi:hypothetical protein
MTDRFVDSAAAGAGTGADWANAYTTLSAAATAAVAGETIYVANTHNESTAATVTITFAGTSANPVRCLCVTPSSASGNSGLATGAAVANTGSVTLTVAGTAYVYGISFSQGSGAGGGQNLVVGSGTSTSLLIFEACAFKLNTTHANSRLALGTSSASGNTSQLVEFVNTSVEFSAAGQAIAPRCPFVWRDKASNAIVLGTAPTSLFKLSTGVGANRIELSGLDLANLTGNIVDLGTNGGVDLNLRDCKLGGGVALKTGSWAGPQQGFIRLHNCDSDDTNYRLTESRYAGDVTQETTIVMTGGASDGVTPFSRKMASAANANFYAPLESPPVLLRNETTGAAKTLTVEIVTDNVTLKNDEAWIEWEYLGDASFPTASRDLDDRVADILTAGVNQASSSQAWTTTGLTTPVKQKLEATFTPQLKGWFRGRVMLARPDTTLYYNPQASIS